MGTTLTPVPKYLAGLAVNALSKLSLVPLLFTSGKH